MHRSSAQAHGLPFPVSCLVRMFRTKGTEVQGQWTHEERSTRSAPTLGSFLGNACCSLCERVTLWDRTRAGQTRDLHRRASWNSTFSAHGIMPQTPRGTVRIGTKMKESKRDRELLTHWRLWRREWEEQEETLQENVDAFRQYNSLLNLKLLLLLLLLSQHPSDCIWLEMLYRSEIGAGRRKDTTVKV